MENMFVLHSGWDLLLNDKSRHYLHWNDHAFCCFRHRRAVQKVKVGSCASSAQLAGERKYLLMKKLAAKSIIILTQFV